MQVAGFLLNGINKHADSEDVERAANQLVDTVLIRGGAGTRLTTPRWTLRPFYAVRGESCPAQHACCVGAAWQGRCAVLHVRITPLAPFHYQNWRLTCRIAVDHSSTW